jgi:hypothetical protein
MHVYVLTALFPSSDAFPDGLVVRIRRSHRRGPGSIPGQGIVFPPDFDYRIVTRNRWRAYIA